MSLINDALKRASEEQSKPPTPADISANLTPVETPAQGNTQFWQVFCVVGLVAVALWLGWAWMGGKSTPNAAQETAQQSQAALEVAARTFTPPPTPGIATPASSGVNATTGTTHPGLTPVVQTTLPAETPVAAVTTPAPTPATAIATPPSPPPAPPAPTPAPETTPTTFPKLVLQGVYYRPSRPSAVINSKTVYVGDKVQQAKILAIDRQEVTVQWNGEVRVLAIE